MKSLLFRASGSYFIRHPGQLALALLGIALGVAVVVAIDLAKDSAIRSFDQATQAISGQATHRIIGGPSGLDESLYRSILVEHGINPAAPKVEGYVSLDSETLRLLGVDPFAEPPFQTPWQPDGLDQDATLTGFVTEPGRVAMTDQAANRLKLSPGESFNLQVGARTLSVTLDVVIRGSSKLGSQQLGDILITDIATAQEILGMIGRLSHIDLMIASGDHALLEKLEKALPQAAELIDNNSKNRPFREMTRAFYTNLSALSLLSLLVAGFLIYNTITFMVVQRRRLFGSLRAIGVTRQQIFQLILTETAILALVGTSIGLIAGIVLGHSLLGLIAHTIDQLYFPLPSSQLSVSGLTLLKGTLLGLGTALIAGVVPANEATRILPLHTQQRSHLESHVRTLAARLLPIGLALALLGTAITLLPSSSIPLGFTGLFAVILGCAFMVPETTVLLTKFLARIIKRRFGIVGILPLRSLAASLSRTGVAMAALMVAIAVTIGMTLMIGSFRLSVAEWLKSRINADFYVSAPAATTASSDNGLSEALLIRIQSFAGIEAVGTVRRIQIETRNGIDRLNAYQLPANAKSGFNFLMGDPAAIWPAFEDKDTAIVSEPYAYHHGLKIGSSLEIRTDNGPIYFKVTGIYSDYNVGQGIISISRSTYDRHWQDGRYSSFWVYTAPGADFEQMKREIRRSTPKNVQLLMTTNRDILGISLEIFDQAFVIAGILRILAAVIAFIGVFGALTALQLERTQEYGILRASGVTPIQLRALVMTETGIMGLIAGFLAIPAGYLVAVLLVYTVNQRSFGWTMTLHINPGDFLQPLLLAVAAALLAGIYPAFKMSQTRPAEALRTE